MSESNCTYLWVWFLYLVVLYILLQIAPWIILKAKLHIWNTTPPDVVILHGFPPSKTTPNPSPFVMKLLTYLRMTNIPYQLDFGSIYYMGPKWKSPWISLNGQHMGDTELIIELLNKQFTKDLDRSYTDEQLALSTATRVMLEEHAFWGMAMQRFMYGGKSFHKVVTKGFIVDTVVRLFAAYRIRGYSYTQGLGRHSEADVFKFISKDLKAVSVLLGRKKFILGDEPCQDDCGIFGLLSQFVWGLPDSPYETLIEQEFPNLKEYCRRMKDMYFENWDELLAK